MVRTVHAYTFHCKVLSQQPLAAYVKVSLEYPQTRVPYPTKCRSLDVIFLTCCTSINPLRPVFRRLQARLRRLRSNHNMPDMALVLPKHQIRDFDDYRHWLCQSGQRYYEQVWSFRNKEKLLQEYVAVCYAKKIPVKINPPSHLTAERLSKKN